MKRSRTILPRKNDIFSDPNSPHTEDRDPLKRVLVDQDILSRWR
jgi:hypothetical protein